MAELIAERLRRRITDGSLRDGDMLPKFEDLLEEFGVSKPSLREALRILETEGLITVRRGNVGGAVVHPPGSRDAAYMIGLVLESRSVRLPDLASAIKYLEPQCAALCAEREDRAEAILPTLLAIQSRAMELIDDDDSFTANAREFHEAIVALCGNETTKLVIGALEALWSARERDWARRAIRTQTFPDDQTRREGIRAHQRLIDLIAQGDAAGASRVARRHLDQSQLYAVTDGDAPIQASAVRGISL